MQLNIIGIISIFVFHSVTMFVLCPSRFNLKKTVAAWTGMTLVCVAACLLIIRFHPTFTRMFLAMLVAIVLFNAVVFFLSDIFLPRTVFLLLTYMQVFMVIVFISGLLSQHLFQGNIFAAILIRCFLQLCFVILCLTFREKFYFISQSVTDGWWPINLLAALLFSYLGILILDAYSMDFNDTKKNLSSILLITVVVAVYCVFFHTINFMNHAAQAERLEFVNKLMMHQVQEIQESAASARRIRHDTRHHNLQIAEYARNGQVDELLRYIDLYEEEIESKLLVRICENIAANNILSAYARKAEQNGISVHFDVAMEQDIGIKDTDIVAILANIMENAIYGCIRAGATDPFIELYIGRKAGKLVIQSRNSTGRGIKSAEGGSSKFSAGVGISSILYSASQYGGESDFREDNGVFVCCILMKIPPKN